MTDLKPENLMLVADPVAPGGERVKILDFGIAKLTRASDRGEVKTVTRAVMGTPTYMSPEQCAGAGSVDGKSDVYSLGCVLYHMLTGRPPFVAEGIGELIGMHQFHVPPALTRHAPKVAKSVAELTHRLLTKDRTQRPGMSEAADALGRLLSKFSGAVHIVRSSIPENEEPAHPLESGLAATMLEQQLGQRSVLASRPARGVPKITASVVVFAVVGITAAYGLGSFAVRHGASKAANPPVTAARAADTGLAQAPLVTSPAATGSAAPPQGQAAPSAQSPAPSGPSTAEPPPAASTPAAPATSRAQPSTRRSSSTHRSARGPNLKNWDPVSP